jgi:hypothetical protein
MIRRHATAARLYGEAFTAQRELGNDLITGHRYKAACAAALADCGQGNDATARNSASGAAWPGAVFRAAATA